MNDLLNAAITAHGGLKRWNEIQRLHAALNVDGAIFEMKENPGLLTGITLDMLTQTQNPIVIKNFAGDGNKSVLADNLLHIEDSGREMLWERYNPRGAFRSTTPWDELMVAYFSSYALWNYLTQPFLYAYKGFETEEISPWEENGETWRRLKIKFPQDIQGHCLEQISYFGADGLLRRHDYTVDVLFGATGANYASDYREFDGIMFPTKRRVYSKLKDGQKNPEPLLVSIDIERIKLN